MHDISNRILRPISGFLVVVFAKIIIDCVIYYITHWNYPKVIFWQSVIVFFFLFYRYFKKHKIQKKIRNLSIILIIHYLKLFSLKFITLFLLIL